MPLTVNNFFKKYIINCFSRDLSCKEKIVVIVLSILTSLFTLCIAHLASYIIQASRFSKLQIKQQLHNQCQKTAKKVQRSWEKFNDNGQIRINHDDVKRKIQEIVGNNSENIDKFARVAVFTACFASYYKIYFNSTISQQDIFVAQIIAVAHMANNDVEKDFRYFKRDGH